MNAMTIADAVTSLRMIFWGGLLCIFDFNISQTSNGQGFTCDILNDAVGTILVAVGVARLSKAPVHDRYQSVMNVVLVVSLLAIVDALRSHVVMQLPGFIQLLINAFGLVKLAAIVAFCVAMRWYCEQASFVDASQSWRVTTILFVVIYAFPLGLFHVVAAFALVTDFEFSFNLGPAGLLLLPVFVIPLVHLFVSTSRMRRAAEQLSGMDATEYYDGGSPLNE